MLLPSRLLSIAVLVSTSCGRVSGLASPFLDSSASISVWDNVLSKETCSLLHDAASSSGLGHRVFLRHEPRTVIEQALESILEEMGDDSLGVVEYWSRQEWRSIEAHADIDENLAKEQQGSSEPFRYPDKGHVLYLQVGTSVRGPTCLFSNVQSGGELLRRDAVELSVVPAVPGRLLRFQGDMLHAVPRPTDLWLLSFVKGAPQFEPQETWGRSVILFNTWPLAPSNVPFSDTPNVCESDLDVVVEPACHPLEMWEPRQVTAASNRTNVEEERLNAKIWLLGDGRRRDHTYRTVKLSAPVELREALAEESQPQQLTLTQA